MRLHPSEVWLPPLTAMQKNVVHTSMNITDIVARLSIWSAKEIQLVIDEVQYNCVPDDELETEAIQHLMTFLITMRDRASAQAGG